MSELQLTHPYHDIFDSHAHYNDERFLPDQNETLQAIHQNGVCAIVNIGADLATSEESRILAERYPYIWFAAGVHPDDAAGLPDDYLNQLKALAAHPKCVAIGEIGLDYFRDPTPLPIQKRVFAEQLDLAREIGKPVVIHTRDATADTIEILRAHPSPGVVHCFSGSAETARELVAMGYYIGFTGVVTFKNARKSLEAAAAVPLDRLLLETDCPYMAPEPNRGKRCQSDMIAFSAEKIAAVKGIVPQALIDAARENTCRLFHIEL